MQSLLRRQVVFTLGLVVFGGLESLFAILAGQRNGVEAVAYSVLLCLVPGWLTIYAGELMRVRDISAYVVLVGTGFRMLFVLLGLVAISVLRPEIDLRGFAVWLVAGYLVALALETWLVLIPQPAKPVA